MTSHRATPLFILAATAGLSLACDASAQPHAKPLGLDAVRFFDSEDSLKAAAPSYILNRPPQQEFPFPANFEVIPEFSTAGGQRVVTIKVPEGTSLYGLGDEPGPMLRNGFSSGDRPVRCAWVMAVRPDGSTFGVIADTTWACSIDLTKDIVIKSDAPTLPVVVLRAERPSQMAAFVNPTTGRMEMPPLWAFGYQQYAGTSEADLRAAGKWLRDNRIPADSLGVATAADTPLAFNRGSLAEPGKTFGDLHVDGFRVVASVTPAFPPDAGAYDEGVKAERWVQNADGGAVTLSADNSRLVLPDITNAAARDWWSNSVHEFLGMGVDGLVVRPAPWAKVADDSKFRADADIGGSGTGAQYRTAAPSLLLRATRAGFHDEQDGRRPVVISDEAMVGTQRAAALRIAVTEEILKNPAAMIRPALSAVLSGQPLVALQIPTSPQDESRLDAWKRVVGLAAMMPIVVSDQQTFRAPSSAAAEALRTILEARSRLTPYLYTHSFFAFFLCDPIVRPVFFEDPGDASLRGLDTMFLLGPNVLVVPRPAGDAPVPAIPFKGGWRKLDLGGGAQSGLPDLYLRPGSILTLGPLLQHTGEKPIDPLTLIVNLDEQGQAFGDLYEDDGQGYGFYGNQCRRTRYTAVIQDGSVMIRLGALDGGFPIPRRKVQVRVLTDNGEATGSGSERGTIKIDLPKSENGK